MITITDDTIVTIKQDVFSYYVSYIPFGEVVQNATNKKVQLYLKSPADLIGYVLFVLHPKQQITIISKPA